MPCENAPRATGSIPRIAAWARRHWPLLLIVACVAGIYGRSLRFPFVNWDDPIHTYRNPAVTRPHELGAAQRWFPRHLGYPMPLTILSYRLDHALHQRPDGKPLSMEDGQGFHLTNFALGLLLVCLVYSLCVRLLERRWTAAVATSLFAFHPVIVEPLTWISGRKDLLAVVFSLAAILCWLRWLRTRRPWPCALGGIFALLAMLGKPNAVFVVPLALFLWFLDRSPAHVAAEAAPSEPRRWPGVVVLALLALTALSIIIVSYRWNSAVGGVEVGRGALVTLRSACWGLGYQLSSLVAPVALRPLYIVSPGTPGLYDLLGAAAVLASLAGLAAAFTGARFRRPGPARSAAIGLAIFLFGYLPVSSLIPLRRFISDTYMLVPLIGLAIIAGALLAWVHAQRSRAFSWVLLGSTVAVAAMLAVISYRQVGIWSDSTVLWRYTMRHHPSSPKVCRLLGEAYNEHHDDASALRIYTACSERFGLDLFANNMAVTYLLLGDHRRAAQLFSWVLSRRPDDERARRYLRQLGHPPPKR